MDKEKCIKIAQNTADILRKEFYINPQGKRVDLSSSLRKSKSAQRTYFPNEKISLTVNHNYDRKYKVVLNDSLSAAFDLQKNGQRVLVLNYGSAKNPGGGWLKGARAQEEDLCRRSGLIYCIRDNEMYKDPGKDMFYKDWIIYTPDVPVFKNKYGDLLEHYFLCSFLTSAAPNAKVLLECGVHESDITPVFKNRIRKILSVAADNNEENLILGAWGCGAFGNNPVIVARLFKEVLTKEFSKSFKQVFFAINKPDSNYTAFVNEFGK
jgi:uncharacterized protein (TIGR02452 family)